MIFLIIYLLCQAQFLFLGVNGNEEDIIHFFTDRMRCVQDIIRETDSMGPDSMVLARLYCELDGHTRTISAFLLICRQLEEGDSRECVSALEAVYICFHSILNSYENSRSVEVTHRDRSILNSLVPPQIRSGHPGRPRDDLAKNSPMLWDQQADTIGIDSNLKSNH